MLSVIQLDLFLDLWLTIMNLLDYREDTFGLLNIFPLYTLIPKVINFDILVKTVGYYCTF